MCTSDFCAAKFTGLRFHRTPVRTERFYLCRKEMHNELTQKDRCELCKPTEHRTAIRAITQRELGIDGRRYAGRPCIGKIDGGDTGTTGDEIQQL